MGCDCIAVRYVFGGPGETGFIGEMGFQCLTFQQHTKIRSVQGRLFAGTDATTSAMRCIISGAAPPSLCLVVHTDSVSHHSENHDRSVCTRGANRRGIFLASPHPGCPPLLVRSPSFLTLMSSTTHVCSIPGSFRYSSRSTSRAIGSWGLRRVRSVLR